MERWREAERVEIERRRLAVEFGRCRGPEPDAARVGWGKGGVRSVATGRCGSHGPGGRGSRRRIRRIVYDVFDRHREIREQPSLDVQESWPGAIGTLVREASSLFAVLSRETVARGGEDDRSIVDDPPDDERDGRASVATRDASSSAPLPSPAHRASSAERKPRLDRLSSLRLLGSSATHCRGVEQPGSSRGS